MLFSPEAHEALVDEPWSVERARTAIAGIVADAESAFDDGRPTHPQDLEDEDPAMRFRTVYLGGAGVVEALHRLVRRGFVELRRGLLPVSRAGRPLAGESRAAVGADRGQRAGRTVRADVGQSGDDPRRP